MATPFKGNVVMVGFGIVGQATLPVLLKEFHLTPDRITIICADHKGDAVEKAYGIKPVVTALTPDNYRKVLLKYLKKGDYLVNLSVNVSSVMLMRLCQEVGALYLDTCIEPWDGYYLNPQLSRQQRTNYVLRETALELRKEFPKGSTAVIAHGANPGIISHLLKHALLVVANDVGKKPTRPPSTHAEWARLARDLAVRVIHVAERDTQASTVLKEKDEFVNTWSIDGFISEGCQPAELGWGTHEKYFPKDGHRHPSAQAPTIYLDSPGFKTRVYTWTPLEGSFYGNLVTHNEAISIAALLTVEEEGEVVYRPTVHYAYSPSNDTLLSIAEFCGHHFAPPRHYRLMREEITRGMDELGILLMGHARKAFWYGSRLTIEEARRVAPFNNATTLQVVAGIIAGMDYAIHHPHEGIVEAEDMDSERALKVGAPYLGELAGVYADWTPLSGRSSLFDEDLDYEDPWQFKNFRVS